MNITKFTRPTKFSSDGDGLRLRRLDFFVGFILKIFHVIDYGDVEGAARAASDFLADSEVFLGDLEKIAAGARVREGLELLVPLHVFDLHVVVRHRTENLGFPPRLIWGRRWSELFYEKEILFLRKLKQNLGFPEAQIPLKKPKKNTVC